MLVGLRVHVRPVEGDIVSVSVTVPPAGLLTLMVDVPVAPALIVTEVGVAVTDRPDVTVTVTVAM